MQTKQTFPTQNLIANLPPLKNPIRLSLFGEQNSKIYTSTRIGILLSLISFGSIIGYFLVLVRSMNNQVFDDLNSVVIYNDFNQFGKIFVLNYTSILPIIYIEYTNYKEFDIFGSSAGQSKVNIQKLNQYFRVAVVVSSKTQHKTQYYQKNYRVCQENDFKGILKEQKQKINADDYLCVDDSQELKDKLILKDGYIGTLDERSSFSVEIQRCQGQGCKSIDEVQKFMQSIVITQYIIEEQADLANYNNLNDRPIVTRLRYLQQFTLDVHKYRDNNNFVRFNKVETKDSKYLNIFQNEYQYIDVISEPVYYQSSQYVRNREVSYDGSNYKMESFHLVSGQFFFLSDIRQEHSRQIGTYIDIFSMLGGLSSIIFGITAFISSAISYQFVIADIIQKVYQSKYDKNEHNIVQINDRRIQKYRKSSIFHINHNVVRSQKNSQQLLFTTLDVLTSIWIFRPLRSIFKRSQLIKNCYLFDRLRDEVEDDLQISNLILNNKLIFLMNEQIMNNINVFKKQQSQIDEQSQEELDCSSSEQINHDINELKQQIVRNHDIQDNQNSQNNLIDHQEQSQFNRTTTIMFPIKFDTNSIQMNTEINVKDIQQPNKQSTDVLIQNINSLQDEQESSEREHSLVQINKQETKEYNNKNEDQQQISQPRNTSSMGIRRYKKCNP